MAPIAGAPAAATPGPDPSRRPESSPAVRQAARDFEALLVHQLLRTMRQASLPPGGPTGQRIYQDVMDEEVARAITRSGGLGVSDMLIRDLVRREAQKALKSEATPADRTVVQAQAPTEEGAVE